MNTFKENPKRIIEFKPTMKQDLMFQSIDDENITEVLYGGSAGSGKSYALCALIIMKALQHPGIRIGLARNELTNLKRTTMVSFFEVVNDWGLSNDLKYNSIAGTIKFHNGSEVQLIELAYKPSDDNYTRLGGLLLTFACIDEVGEVPSKGYTILKSRINRWHNTKHKIRGKIISTCNPSKNWLYKEFYKPWNEGYLPKNKLFIQALPTDNPYLPKEYIETLKELPLQERERLLNGNWDFSDDENQLLSFLEIENMFIDEIEKDNEEMFISVDPAFMKDNATILIWSGLTVIKIFVYDGDDLEKFIKDKATEYNISHKNICFDSDGPGTYLRKKLKLAKPIINNGSTLNKGNFKNLKNQLYYKLIELISQDKIKIIDSQYTEMIKEELYLIHYKEPKDVGKLEIKDKTWVKQQLGRSPDFADNLAYRMIFELTSRGAPTFRIG